MEKKKVIGFWLKSAKRDKKTAEDLFKLGHFHWCLFIWHLVLEKVLKALITKNNQTITPIHDLVKLSKSTGLSFNKDQTAVLNEATAFNLEARYDSYKESFFQKANQEYAQQWAGRLKELYQCLLKEF